MATSLFKSNTPPEVSTVDVTEVPTPGPNAVEVAVLSYDPDTNILHIGMPNDVQAIYQLNDMATEGSSFTIQLADTKLGPRVNVEVVPRTAMPRFTTPEEADAWLEANT